MNLKRAALIEPTGTEALRPGVVEQCILCHLPAEIRAASESGEAAVEAQGIQIGKIGVIDARIGDPRRTVDELASTASSGGADLRRVGVEVACADCQGQRLRNKVEVDRKVRGL